MDLSGFPKIEIHLHLDCSLSYEVAQTLVPSLTKDQYRRDFIAPPKCRDLADYLVRAEQGFQLMQDKRALQLVTHDLFDQLAADEVIYTEIRFAPLLHTRQGMTPEAVVEAVLEAGREAEARTGISHRFILCTLRSHSARIASSDSSSPAVTSTSSPPWSGLGFSSKTMSLGPHNRSPSSSV